MVSHLSSFSSGSLRITIKKPSKGFPGSMTAEIFTTWSSSLSGPLPKKVLGHPWLLSGDDKMSKSKGNVLYADDLARHFGVDAVRYYLLSEIPFAQDGTITYESLINKYNADLANTLGNLVDRTIAMTNKYFDGKVTKPTAAEGPDADLLATVEETLKKYVEQMDAYHNADAAATVMNLAGRCNK